MTPHDPPRPTDDDQPLEEDELEPFREVPVGTNDPNIVGEVGPFDKPPGHDEQEGFVEDDTDVEE